MTTPQGIWDLVYKLNGQTICTPARKAVFEIGEVNDSVAYIFLQSSGQKWGLWRDHLELAWNHLIQHGTLDQSQISSLSENRTGKSSAPSYMAAIIAQMPDVTVTTGRSVHFVYNPSGKK